jgi:cyanophycinase
MIIDQHFAQRARIERLIAAVAENPAVLGLGIDEDTGVILEGEDRLVVTGSGAVYVADGHGVTYSNMSEQASGRTLCLFDVRLHVLCHNTGFDLKTRKPFLVAAPADAETESRATPIEMHGSRPRHSRRSDMG